MLIYATIGICVYVYRYVDIQTYICIHYTTGAALRPWLSGPPPRPAPLQPNAWQMQRRAAGLFLGPQSQTPCLFVILVLFWLPKGPKGRDTLSVRNQVPNSRMHKAFEPYVRKNTLDSKTLEHICWLIHADVCSFVGLGLSTLRGRSCCNFLASTMIAF